ncbi:MAG: hypothetical protein U1F77_02160 [Kiritimatiellia bacterium]
MNRSAFLRLLALCLLPTWSAAAPAGDTNVLFIGNSYTAPVVPVFREFAKAKGKTGRIEAVIGSSARELRRHVEQGDAVRLIGEGGWNAVCPGGSRARRRRFRRSRCARRPTPR